MSDNNWDGIGGIILLVIFFAMFGNNNGGGFFGRNNDPAATAALVEQNTINRSIGNIQSTQECVGAQIANIGKGVDVNMSKIDSLRDKTDLHFSQLQTDLCQLGNNLTQQNTALSTQMATCCCELKQRVADSEAHILGAMQQSKIEALQDQNSTLKTMLATQNAACDRDKQTATILAAMQTQNGCCTTNNGCCFNNNLLTTLSGINTSLAAIAAKVGVTTTATA